METLLNKYYLYCIIAIERYHQAVNDYKLLFDGEDLLDYLLKLQETRIKNAEDYITYYLKGDFVSCQFLINNGLLTYYLGIYYLLGKKKEKVNLSIRTYDYFT